jgi:hypothetical protein
VLINSENEIEHQEHAKGSIQASTYEQMRILRGLHKYLGRYTLTR